MALIYQTTLSPTKLELIANWLPAQPWFSGEADQLEAVGAYRFDDPEGEVGMETHLVTAGTETIYQVPLTYRGAPLEDGDAFLLGTVDHGVLGRRWFTDGLGDPVYRDALARAIAQGGREADEWVTDDPSAAPVQRETVTKVQGSGSPEVQVPELWAAAVRNEGPVTLAETDLATLTLVRALHQGPVELPRAGVLRGTWPGQAEPVLLAALTV